MFTFTLMRNNNPFNRNIILLALMCMVPFLVFYVVPEKWLLANNYRWLMTGCAVVGIIASQSLKNLTQEPYEKAET
jgi:hypothetical protein